MRWLCDTDICPVYNKEVLPGAYACHQPSHWVFAGTGLSRGDSFGAAHTIVGYECDGCEFTLNAEGVPSPTYKDGNTSTY
jgi:hypothetical protein